MNNLCINEKQALQLFKKTSTVIQKKPNESCFLLISNHPQPRRVWRQKTVPQLLIEGVSNCSVQSYFGYRGTADIIAIKSGENSGHTDWFPSAKIKPPEFYPPDWKIKMCLAVQIAFPLLCTKLGLTIFMYHFERRRN